MVAMIKFQSQSDSIKTKSVWPAVFALHGFNPSLIRLKHLAPFLKTEYKFRFQSQSDSIKTVERAKFNCGFF